MLELQDLPRAAKAFIKASRLPPWIPVLRKDPCAYCGGSGGTVDHLIPVIKGGTGIMTNLTGACDACNQRKDSENLLLFLLEAFKKPT